MKTKVIVLLGPSGSGKDTILKLALDNIPEVSGVVGYTTRPPRDYEIEGKDYYFIDYETYTYKLLSGELLEGVVYNGWGYGTDTNCYSKNKINIATLPPARINLLIENSDFEVYPILIETSDKTRLIRQLTREDNPDIEEIIRRYGTDKEDFENLPFEYETIKNEYPEDLATAISRLRSLVKNM